MRRGREMIRVSHDYLDPGFIADPYPYFKKIRSEMPVHWNERWRGWIGPRYDDVYAALHKSPVGAYGFSLFSGDEAAGSGEIRADLRRPEQLDGLHRSTEAYSPASPDAAGVHAARDLEDA